MIKQKLLELLGVCFDNNIQFNYIAGLNAVAVFKLNGDNIEYITQLYSLESWNGSEEQHIAKLNEFIKQVQEMN